MKRKILTAIAAVLLLSLLLTACGTAAPTPTATPTPKPTATPTPKPTATPTPKPAATPTPKPTATPAPTEAPISTPLELPDIGPIAVPSPTPTPTPQKVEEVCKHSFQDTVVEPTCLSGGYTTHVCTKCGYSYTDAETPSVGHFYRDGYCIWCGTPLPGGIWWDTTVELSEDLL